ncbi:MAG TPA: FMN-binding protein [Candidatus Paceibacterota bacterium]|nr:FMN-binding protein [Candidatus Paceibacterota bacterium]
MKNAWKYVLAIIAVVVIAGYAIFSSQRNSNVATTGGGQPSSTPTPSGSGSGATSSGTGTTGTGSGSGTGTGTGGTGSGSGSGSGTTSLYKNGTYTGTAADAFYGTIQVSAVISGGKLTDVKFLQYPNDPGHTAEVSREALPQLKQEAITAQSATVDIVSGATQDSQAFQQSLASALAQAKV